jgi:hypothetical protein
MPNYISNRLRVTGPKSDLHDFLAHQFSATSFTVPLSNSFQHGPRSQGGGPCDWEIESARVDHNDAELLFYTSWVPPIEGVLAASKAHPRVRLTLSFVDEFGDFSGECVCEGGHSKRQSFAEHNE